MNLINELHELAGYIEKYIGSPTAANQIELFTEEFKICLSHQTFIPLSKIEHWINGYFEYQRITVSRKFILRVKTHETLYEMDFDSWTHT